ncbi:MAG TPA: serine/threonine-protein kinase [Drouetiella sp.]
MSNASQLNFLPAGYIFENRFEIVEVLGRGAVGVVYEARHLGLGKLVAIKMLLSAHVTDESEYRRFQQEAQAASSLSNQNIINVTDFGLSAEGYPYLVMEYLRGESLTKVLEAGRLNLDEFLHIFQQVCSGLQAAHKKGMVHRDIKPSNLMLIDTEDATRVVKIVDFGLAKAILPGADQSLTATGMVVGTPLFMSPEQCRGKDLDQRSDIYSLGCVMYAALTGRYPFEGESTMDTIYKHMVEPPPPFAQMCPELNLPASIEKVILKSVEKDPANRQQSMAELSQELTKAITEYNKPHVTPGGMMEAMSERKVHRRTADEMTSTVYSGSGNARPLEQTRLRAQEVVPERKSNWVPIATTAALLVGGLGAGAFFLTQKHPEKQASPPTTAAIQTAKTSEKSASTNSKGSEENSKSAKSQDNESASKAENSKSSKQKKQSTSVASNTVPVSHIVPPAAPALPKVETEEQKRHRALARIVHEKGLAGKAAVEQGDFDTARACYQTVLDTQTAMLGPNDVHLIPTLQAIMHCLTKENDENHVPAYMQQALRIYSSKGDTPAKNEINKLKDPWKIWRGLAHSAATCAEVTRKTALASGDLEQSRAIITDYLKWSADFYSYAIKMYPGSPSDKECTDMTNEFQGVMARAQHPRFLNQRERAVQNASAFNQNQNASAFNQNQNASGFNQNRNAPAVNQNQNDSGIFARFRNRNRWLNNKGIRNW